MSKQDLIEVNGVVTNHVRGIYTVECDTGQVVQAQLSGKMKKYNIRVVEGDKVKVGLSPYDLKRGIITFRHAPERKKPQQ